MRTVSEMRRLPDEDHSGNDSNLFPGSLNSEMSPERVRSEPELVGPKETHVV